MDHFGLVRIDDYEPRQRPSGRHGEPESRLSKYPGNPSLFIRWEPTCPGP